MVIYNLQEELYKILPDAEEIYIAVALTKLNALEELFELLPSDIPAKFIAGVDLPTTVEALSFLKDLTHSRPDFQAGISYDHATTFHPKLYIVKMNGEYIAFVGSANLTNGGLQTNIELSYKISDQSHCKDLLLWFEATMSNSFPIDDHNIEQYCNERPPAKAPLRSKMRFKRAVVDLDEDAFSKIDFTDRYFKREHHYAFRRMIWKDDSPSVIKERKLTEDRFLELNNGIYPQFLNYGLLLDTNTPGNVVSRYQQINPKYPIDINAMWLSYGKTQNEIKDYQKNVPKKDDIFQTFIHHARLQVRLEFLSIGIWILFGKRNGSSFDKGYFKKSMRDVNYRRKFYNLIKALPSEYWMRVGGGNRACSSFQDADDLHEYCKNDSLEHYFIIGRDYKVTDPEMSEKNLPTVVLQEFQRQFPIYDLMRDKTFLEI